MNNIWRKFDKGLELYKVYLFHSCVWKYHRRHSRNSFFNRMGHISAGYHVFLYTYQNINLMKNRGLTLPGVCRFVSNGNIGPLYIIVLGPSLSDKFVILDMKDFRGKSRS